MLKLLNTKTQKYSAAMMTGALLGFSSNVSAQTLDEYFSTATDRVNTIPDFISFLSYVGGAALAALGVVKLKQHVENPGNNPMKDGLARLGFGGMLLALPSVMNVMMDTSQGGANTGPNFSTVDLNGL